MSRHIHRFGGALTEPSSRDPVDIAFDYLEANSADLGVEPADVRELEIASAHRSESSGVTHLYFQQTVLGIPVRRGRVAVHVLADGRILSVGSHLVAEAAEKAKELRPLLEKEDAARTAAHAALARRAASSRSPIDARAFARPTDALARGRGGFRIRERGAGEEEPRDRPFRSASLELPQAEMRPARSPGTSGRATSPPPAKRNGRAPRVTGTKLALVAVREGLRLVWTARVEGPVSGAAAFLVDACSGEVLGEESLEAHGTDRYRVFPLRSYAEPSLPPVTSPSHGEQRIVEGAAAPRSSPHGWFSTTTPSEASGTETRGNNVTAGERLPKNGVYRPDGGSDGQFLFEEVSLADLDRSIDPAQYRDAAITNLFYTLNVLHDVFYAYGFNEAAGNFQDDNFDRPGRDGDGLRAFRGSWLGNASFAWAEEGRSPVLKMGFNWIYPIKQTLYRAGPASRGAAAIDAADFDGDGDIDLVTANEGSANLTVFWNDGRKGFTASPPLGLEGGYAPRDLAVGDFDASGTVDIAVANTASDNVTVFYNRGDGRRFHPVTLPLSPHGARGPSSLAAADLDGDGDLDLAVGNESSRSVTILRNHSAGAFFFEGDLRLPGKALDVIALDVDSDTRTDLVVLTSTQSAVSIIRNAESMRFEHPDILPLAGEPGAIDRADLDLDGDPDLLIAARDADRILVLENEGRGTADFSHVRSVHVGTRPIAVVAAERTAAGDTRPLDLYTADGRANTRGDLVALSASSASLSIRLNLGDLEPWHFAVPPSRRWPSSRGDLPLGEESPAAVVAARLDRDTHVDVAVAYATNPVTVGILSNDSEAKFQRAISVGAEFVRDNALENSYITHEFGHGVVWRLTGGSDAMTLRGMHGFAMDEGWADFFALLFTQEPGPEKPRGLWTFWKGEPRDGPGVRSVPYTTQRDLNPLTFGDYNWRRCQSFRGSSCRESCGEPALCDRGGAANRSPHFVGEIWASVLWDIYWELVARHGQSGNLHAGAFGPEAGAENIALQLVIDGLKLQPPSPSFLEARDAILLADQVSFGGAHLDLLWTAFAARGMGWNACDNWFPGPEVCWHASNDSRTVKEDFSLPPRGTIRGNVIRDGESRQDGNSPQDERWTVFLDRNGNGVLEETERSAVTNAEGAYEFTDLYPGSYELALDVSPGWKQVLPAPDPVAGHRVRRWEGSGYYGTVKAGGDFAYLGHRLALGVDIIDLHRLENDPENALASTWSHAGGSNQITAIEVTGSTAYFASGNGGGVFVVDVRNPYAPLTLTRITSGHGGSDRVSGMSARDGYLYLADGSPYVRVFDIRRPRSPRFVRDVDLYPHGGGGYVRNVVVEDGRLYACEFSAPGYVHIFDVRDVRIRAPHVVSFVSGENTHSCWPAGDGQYLVVARETQIAAANQVEIWEVSDAPGVSCTSIISMGRAPDSPRCAWTVIPGEQPSPHEVVVDGNLLYVAWYAAGLVVLDISDPARPREIHRVDTYPGPPQLSTGCWSVDPSLGPQKVLVSDTESGLHLLSTRASHRVTIEGGNVVTRNFYVQATDD